MGLVNKARNNLEVGFVLKSRVRVGSWYEGRGFKLGFLQDQESWFLDCKKEQ
jgi:hypothetical protein